MTTVTLELPDELAGRLAPIQQQLPQMLTFALDMIGYPGSIPSKPDTTHLVLTETLDFLANSPSRAEIIAFKISPDAQSRLEELLYLQREQQLLSLEQAELASYQQVNHLLILLKARARVGHTPAH